MRQLNRNAIFGPNIFGSTISLLAMTIRLTPQMIYGSRCVFFAKNTASDWQNMKLLAKDRKIWQIGSDEKIIGWPI